MASFGLEAIFSQNEAIFSHQPNVAAIFSQNQTSSLLNTAEYG
jgi:hypothetical protein